MNQHKKNNDNTETSVLAVNWLRILVSALIISGLWSSWAFFVNYEYGFEVRSKAGMTQGGVSFFVAFFMTLLLEYLYGLFADPIWRIILSVVATMSIVIGFTGFAHIIMQTPEIIGTMALPCLAGTVYSIIYCLKLRQEQGHISEC